jgi:hypothetical protein
MLFNFHNCKKISVFLNSQFMCNNKGPMFISPISVVSSRPAEKKSIGSFVIGYVIKNSCQNGCNVV